MTTGFFIGRLTAIGSTRLIFMGLLSVARARRAHPERIR
jgi:hypothetical protein